MKIPAQSAPVARGATARQTPGPASVGPSAGCNPPWWECTCSVTGTSICCDPLQHSCPPNGGGGCSCA